MRIAILGSVALPVPPPFQGGTEWIAYYQAKGLAKLGYKVILFAASGSNKDEGYEVVEVGGGDTVIGSKRTSVILGTSEARTPESQSDSGRANACQNDELIESSRPLRKENAYLAQVIEELIKRKDDYDIVLNNMRGEAIFLPLAKMLSKKFVNVMHLPIFPELAEIFKKYNTYIITVSNAQRKGFPDLNYLATINNCVDIEEYVFVNGFRKGSDLRDNQGLAPTDYLLMLGTIGRHKNQKGAIEVAKKTGMKLVLAGKIRDHDYYKELQKDIDGDIIRWVGELGFGEKLKLYQNAKAFIFPILWEEPFGLVMIEAMACGTPVVAFGNGAVPEVVRDGVTGYITNPKSEIRNPKQIQNPKSKIQKTGIDGLVEAVRRINAMSKEEYCQMRIDCRKHVEKNFTVEKMVRDYESVLKYI